MFLAILGRFSPTFHIFDLSIFKFVLQTFIYFHSTKNLEARPFFASKLHFRFLFFIIFFEFCGLRTYVTQFKWGQPNRFIGRIGPIWPLCLIGPNRTIWIDVNDTWGVIWRPHVESYEGLAATGKYEIRDFLDIPKVRDHWEQGKVWDSP